MNSHERRVIKRAIKQAGLQIVSPQADNPRIDTQEKTPSPKSNTASWRRIFKAHKWFWNFALAAVTLSGIGVWQLWPKIAIDVYASLDPHAPFKQQFVVQNNNIYAIHQLNFGCGIVNMNLNNRVASGFSVVDQRQSVDHLTSGAKTNFACSIDIPSVNAAQFHRLQISVWAKYKTPLGFDICQTTNFEGLLASDSTIVWTYRGAESCP